MLKELQRQILLEHLDDAELEKIGGHVEKITYTGGSPIFSEGERTRGIFMLNFGEVEISKKLPIDMKTKMLISLRNVQHCCDIRKTPYGWKQVFAKLIEGFFFGELSIVEGRETHGADAVALEDTELLLLRTANFEEICKENPAIRTKIMKTIAKVASKNVRHLDQQLLKTLIGY